MSSGSLKDLTKAITSSIATPALPLPSDLLESIQAYLDKHSNHDESDCLKLQDELRAIFHREIAETPSRFASFLAILQQLKPAIKGSGRLLQWWETLSDPILNQLGEQKGLAAEARNILLDVLVYDEDESELEDAVANSDAVAEHVFSTWLANLKSAELELDDEAKFIEGQLKAILLAFGKKRPKNFMITINKFVVQKQSRIYALSILGEFIRHQPPHLHQLLQTDLLDSLLKCLQVDTSTRVISLAMTALIMFLPHIPASLNQNLPALFNIYCRMLFWDRERKVGETSADSADSNEKTNEKTAPPNAQWVKLSYLLESEDEMVPELLHYFTFLYGLYPLNFMSYIRKPQRYLRHANFEGANDLEVDDNEIRQRSEPFRQVHLLHPNFFTMTIESELSDTNRFMRSEASDVVASCMALYSPGDSHLQGPASRTGQHDIPFRIESNSDIPEQPLLDQEHESPCGSRHTSWRNTMSTAVASPSGLHRKGSMTSQTIPEDSPSIKPQHRTDSPTLPPHIALSTSHVQLHEMLNSQTSTKGSFYHDLKNGSVHSLALSHNTQEGTAHADAYLQSREFAPRSPSLRPVSNDPTTKVDYLNREIMLLKNDLNFERYLKQQHLTHIGQLRRKAIREARVEAETQNLINSNRGLKAKLEVAKRDNLQMKKESEKSRNHSRKWEADLTTKLRALKEEQKKWVLEGDQLRRDLDDARADHMKLRQIIVTAEARELTSLQKVKSVELNLDELEHLRKEVEKLTVQVRTYEAQEIDAEQAKEDKEAALKTIQILQWRIAAKDAEFAKARQSFEEELWTLKARSRDDTSYKPEAGYTQDMVDIAVASAQTRLDELKRAHTHLLKKYEELQSDYLDLRERLSINEGREEPLLGGISTTEESPSPSAHRNRTLSYDQDLEGTTCTNSTGGGSGSSAFPVKSPRLDSASYTSSTSNSIDARSPVSPNAPHGATHFLYPQPYSTTQPTKGSSIDGDSLDGHGKPKIKPQSEHRIYGRGGIQNIGKKEKDKKEKETKDKNGKKDGEEKDKDKDKKKGSGLGSIRGIRSLV